MNERHQTIHSAGFSVCINIECMHIEYANLHRNQMPCFALLLPVINSRRFFSRATDGYVLYRGVRVCLLSSESNI